MASTTVLQPASSARVRLLTFPREHGAWGMLLVPLTAGAAVGLRSLTALIPTILFAIAAVALFCLRTPAESLTGTTAFRPQTGAEYRAVALSVAAYASTAVLAIAALLWLERSWTLIFLGGVVAALLLGQAALKKLGRDLRMSAQLIGALGLTSTAAAAYYVVAGRMDSTALVLWALNWLFAANQIHFVQLRIHAARATTREEKLGRGRSFLIGEALLLSALVLVGIFRLVPALALLAFAPVLTRGLTWILTSNTSPLEVRHLGKSELAHAIVFGALLILSFRLGI